MLKERMVGVIATIGAMILMLPQPASVPSGKSTEGAMKTHATAITAPSRTSLVTGLNKVRKPWSKQYRKGSRQSVK